METKYRNLSEKFLMKSFDYQKQFSHLYAHRLSEMTSMLQSLIKKCWGTEYPIRKLCELREENAEKCIVIGTIYKHQCNKPSILREISEENQLAPQPARKHYADPEDQLILEDELQRVRLQGKVEIGSLATGVICAVLGVIEEDGRFDVEDSLFYESGPQRPLSINSSSIPEELIVLVSGLDQIRTELDCVDSLNLFQFWLGGSTFNKKLKKNSIARLIIAGNSVRTSNTEGEMELSPQNLVSSMCTLDKWFTSWSTSVAVDIMPGAYDPSNFMLPQQPFHRCMFPKASQHSTFQSVTNPYACSINDALITGTSGQNINDLLRTTLFDQPLDALRSTLKWGHLAPTAPDTLACYPYTENDPLIMHECPHIYFAGNCKEFATELHTGSQGQKTRLVCVPSFSKTKSVAVVNSKTLDCKQIFFADKPE